MCLFKDEKPADEGGVLIEEEPVEQKSSDSDRDANDPNTLNNMESEILTDVTHISPPPNEEEPQVPQANFQTAKESPPKKHVPKNVVTSWSDWVAKTTANVNKETQENTEQNTSSNSTSRPRVKR